MTTIDHTFLRLDAKYLYSNYIYKIKFLKSSSKYNWKKHVYESSYSTFNTTATFKHQTDKYYVFKNPSIRILKENLIEFEVIAHE